jgi:hypothetical protein
MTRKTAGLWMVLVLASCGGSSGSGSTPSDLDRFIGTWTISTGTLMATCPPLPTPVSSPLTGDQMVQKGTDSDLVFNVQPMCHLLVDVNGNVATVRPRQSCTVTAAGANVPGTVESGNLTVSGETASFTVGGTAANPLGGTCTFTGVGMSARTAGP